MVSNTRVFSIGVFDSGVGGLSILKSIMKKLPRYNYVYLGDNANVPYGDKSKREIRKLVIKAVDFLFKKNCFLIILACNTATANALRYVQKHILPKKYPQRRVLGIIRPVTELVSSLSYGTIGIIATSATVRSRSFIKEIRKSGNRLLIHQKACPLLVPYIEKGKKDKTILENILKKYLLPLRKKKISHLILGCTHYTLVQDSIQKIIGEKTTVINEGQITTNKLKSYLARHPEIEGLLKKDSKQSYFVTKPSKSYSKLMKIFLNL